MGPAVTTSPPNKKTLYNQGAIHILVMAAKNKEPVSFLVPLQVLCFTTSNIVRSKSNNKPLLREKNNVKKCYCDNDFTKTLRYFDSQAERRLLKLPTVPWCWTKLNGIIENKWLFDKQKIFTMKWYQQTSLQVHDSQNWPDPCSLEKRNL